MEQLVWIMQAIWLNLLGQRRPGREDDWWGLEHVVVKGDKITLGNLEIIQGWRKDARYIAGPAGIPTSGWSERWDEPNATMRNSKLKTRAAH